MRNRYGIRTWTVVAVVVLGVFLTVACNGKKPTFPTQPAANNFQFPDNPALGDLVASFDFAASPEPGDRTVIFTDSSSGNISLWRWDFGDGTRSAEQNPVHKFRKYDTFVVTLTVSNDETSDTAAQFVTVTEAPPPPPPSSVVASFTYSVSPGSKTAVFNDTSSGSPTSWLWVFGDGATSTASNPSHEYAEFKAYAVSLTASNSSSSDTHTQLVNVSEEAEPPE